MKIGIDLDGTITDFNSAIIKEGKRYGKKQFGNGKIANKSAYDIENIFLWKEQEVVEFKEYIRTFYRMKIKPRKSAVKVIRYLHNKGHKIYIVTSRKEVDQADVYNNTVRWLNKNNIYYDKLCLGNSNKADVCIKNHIDVLIDDKIKHYISCKRMGINCLLFDNLYNKECNTIDRIYSFDDLKKLF